jgi:hypothetical protein
MIVFLVSFSFFLPYQGVGSRVSGGHDGGGCSGGGAAKYY